MNTDSGRNTTLRRRARTHLALLPLLLIASLFGPAGTALAGKLEDLRKGGLVGERYDGLLAIRDKAAAADIKAAVEEINAKRLEIYQKRASEQNVPADQVGRVYAKQILDEAPAGTWFLGEDRVWVQKK